MTTELVNRKAGSTALDPAQQRAAVLAKVAARKAEGAAPQPSLHGNLIFAKFDGNSGEFVAGRDKVNIAPDQRFVVPLEMIQWGCQRWEGGKPAERKLIAMVDGPRPIIPPNEARVGDNQKRPRDGWQECGILRMTGIEGDMDKIEIELSLSSQGGTDAFNELSKTMYDQADTQDGAAGFFNAVIVVEADSYENKTYSKTVYFPIFKIVGWTDGETIIEVDVDMDDPLG
jgi:hypothetical protein